METFYCRSCAEEGHPGTKTDYGFKTIFDFGLQPWCNGFLKQEDFNTEKSYPLELVQCKNCNLLQLNYTVPKETMFLEHDYVSGTTKTLANHFLELATENMNQFPTLHKDDLIVDIGGNDGTQLLQYQKLGFTNLLNVESATNIAKLSEANKIPTLNKFFNEKTVTEHIPLKAKLINASGVFFHLEELHSVITGIKKLLEQDGVFIVQFMYATDIIKKTNFDAVYHEHLCYYTIRTLQRLLLSYGLEIFDAYHSDIHSGSMIAKIKHSNGIYLRTERFYDARSNDDITNEDFDTFAENIDETTNNLLNLLQHYHSLDKTIYAYGAPAKGNTLLNYLNSFGIEMNSIITKAVEVNENKVGKYTPGTHIPIVKESINVKELPLPAVYLLLSHNFLKEIITKNLPIITERNVEFIVPFPKLMVINKDNYHDYLS